MWAFKLVCTLLLTNVLVNCEEEWSWGKNTKQKTDEENKPKSDTTAEGSVNPNVIEEIITSGRDGRMLTGFSDVYEDQDVQDAISSGNETHARSLVRERLCGLGLMAVSISTWTISLFEKQKNICNKFPYNNELYFSVTKKLKKSVHSFNLKT